MVFIHKMLIIFTILYVTNTVDLECNKGVPILIRIPKGQNQYTLKYHCLCPQNYYSYNCAYSRKISCILDAQNKQIVISNKHEQNEKGESELMFDFTQQCYKKGDYLQPRDQVNQEKISDYQLAKNMYLKAYVEWRESHNHTNVYAGDGFEVEFFKVSQDGYDAYFNSFAYQDSDPFKNGIQILWANDTKMFNANGVLKIPEVRNYSNITNKQSPKQFFFRQHLQLQKYKPYQGFQYMHFMGYPMANQQPIYYFKNIKLQGKNTELKIKDIKQSKAYSRLLQLPIDISDFDFDSSKIPIQKRPQPQLNNFRSFLQLQQLEEKDIVRTELSLYLKSKDTQFLEKISLKDANWEVILQYNQKNQTKYNQIYNAKPGQGFYKLNAQIILVTFIFGASLITCLVVFCYKLRKATKSKDYENYEDQQN